MNQVIRTILQEWKERKLPNLINRDLKIDLDHIQNRVRNAVVITGFRRVGKTYIVFEAIQDLLKQYDRGDVVYVNFEDERLVNIETDILTNLIPESISVFGKKPKYLFLDEIQVVPNWSKWVRRILDTEEVEIIITGSSSKLGSNELPTELRGRAWELKVNPLNYGEFLRFKNVDTSGESYNFKYYFSEYIKYGGLPAVVLTEDEKKNELLQMYYNTVVQREILDRYKINNDNILRTLLSFLLNSNYVTISNLFNTLKSLGLSVGKTTIDKYIGYIKSSYFMFDLKIFNYKIVNQLMYPRKNYFIDNGFLTALSTKYTKDYGKLFENIVCQNLTNLNNELYYWKDTKGREVDFVVFENGKVNALYQACYDITDFGTLDRETRSLLKAKKDLDCDNLNLIVFENGNKVNLKEGINIINASDFFHKSSQ